MKKRPTLKGKGADIFFSDQPKHPKKEIVTGKEKATFYLPPRLLANLDDAWFKLRKNNRKTKKSDIVKIALEKFLKDFEKGTKHSTLVKQLDS